MRPGRTRPSEEVTNDIEVNRIALASLGVVIDDADELYGTYKKTFEDIKLKLEIVESTRQKAQDELKSREDIWRSALTGIVARVNEKFRRQLDSIDATGDVRVSDVGDIENAGLTIVVGFRQSEPVELNYFTQSGGERSVSVISFLLSLQSFISSPVRAVDEFDVHMDPVNRAAFFRMLTEEVKKNRGICYISITPGRVPEGVQWDSAILVQNTYGSSSVSVIEPNE
jgi:chromosome segregation protein